MRLHLKYRLWIAEMNANTSVLRIFNDYLGWLKQNKNTRPVENCIDSYLQRFADLRKELDELRHEMHIAKMKLAALSKNGSTESNNIKEVISHKACKERYKTFRKKFAETKKEFTKLEEVA